MVGPAWRRALGFGAILIVIAGLGTAISPNTARAEERFIVLASTTSTANSGLFDVLLPAFRAATGIGVRVVAVGTGQALRIGRNGDADALLIHDREGEDQFVAEGFGAERRDVMYNDFVIVGPADDPASVHGLKDAALAMRRIADGKHPFVSRGDDSGTHRREIAVWRKAAIDARAASGTWYRETGSGMGATLNTAVAMAAYTLADRGTCISFKNRGGFRILVEGDPELFNPYGVIAADPRRHPHVKHAMAQTFVDWITGPAGQAAIAAFRIDGEQAFFPAAKSR